MIFAILPDFVSSDDKNRLSKKKIIFKGIFFYLKSIFLLIVVVLSMIVILNLLNVNTEPLKYPLEAEMAEMKRRGIFYALFLVVFFGPFIEELSFRLGVSFNRKHVAISAGGMAYLLSSQFSGSGYFDYIYYKLAIAILVGLLLYRMNQATLDKIQEKYGKGIIWVTILFFGFLHVTNYAIEATYFLPLYFVMCLPQVLMGIVFVYFRLNLGFVYALGFHCLLNGISFLTSLSYS